MEDYVKKSIYDLLVGRRASLKETKIFKKWKHNKDLVPQFNNKINLILEQFERYHRICYEIQGIKDKGIDVLVKYEIEAEDKFIGIQIKSYDDLNKEHWLQNLKAQMTDVNANYQANSSLVDFYIAFCTDLNER